MSVGVEILFVKKGEGCKQRQDLRFPTQGYDQSDLLWGKGDGFLAEEGHSGVTEVRIVKEACAEPKYAIVSQNGHSSEGIQVREKPIKKGSIHFA